MDSVFANCGELVTIGRPEPPSIFVVLENDVQHLGTMEAIPDTESLVLQPRDDTITPWCPIPSSYHVCESRETEQFRMRFDVRHDQSHALRVVDRMARCQAITGRRPGHVDVKSTVVNADLPFAKRVIDLPNPYFPWAIVIHKIAPIRGP